MSFQCFPFVASCPFMLAFCGFTSFPFWPLRLHVLLFWPFVPSCPLISASVVSLSVSLFAMFLAKAMSKIEINMEFWLLWLARRAKGSKNLVCSAFFATLICKNCKNTLVFTHFGQASFQTTFNNSVFFYGFWKTILQKDAQNAVFFYFRKCWGKKGVLVKMCRQKLA